MKKSEFLIELEELFQREEPCLENDLLSDYEEWDSLSKMSAMAFFEKKFGVPLTFSDLKQASTVNDLIKLANGNIE